MNDASTTTTQPTTISIAGADIEVLDRGQGAPILFLQSSQGITAAERFIELLAKNRRVIAPSHPGFGRSTLPDWLDSVEDIAHIYLELMDRLKLDNIDLVGCSVGGWIAADMATKVPERLKHLVLVGPVGVKTGPIDKLEVPDIFAMAQDKLNALIYHDPKKSAPDFKTLSEPELQTFVRNRETLALLGWEPYMHNPKLKHRLHRVNVPTLLARGASDGLVSAGYLASYAALLPNARTITVAEAGHVPHIEQPDKFAATVLDFLAS
jgi:pimeloyl-ACP methyl ester carboxylesterase